jgi:3-deoxy-D-manno-octulosonic-acid transferase
MRLFYNIGIRLYWLLALLVSPWNPKAKQWIKGRKAWREKLSTAFAKEDRLTWFHCASLGEFEQGRPIIEASRERFPGTKVLLTFFSPSGYEKRKNFEGADYVMYLPLDTPRNASFLLDALNIDRVIFVKYEFWYHFLKQLNIRRIPTYLASANFREGQVFFRWYGRWYRSFLKYFTHIFVQKEESRKLLSRIGYQEVTVSGDTRFDRVSELPASSYTHKAMEDFTSGSKVLVAGSTWEKDELLLAQAYKELPDELLWIIAPHELSRGHLSSMQKRFPDSVLFTEMGEVVPEGTRVIIVDTIGQLSYLYRFGTLAYIGGGFGKGIHNILEAATYGLPVIFGPAYHKFAEAVELIELGGAFPVSSEEVLLSTIHQQLGNSELLKTTSRIAESFVRERVGATSRVLGICE